MSLLAHFAYVHFSSQQTRYLHPPLTEKEIDMSRVASMVPTRLSVREVGVVRDACADWLDAHIAAGRGYPIEGRVMF